MKILFFLASSRRCGGSRAILDFAHGLEELGLTTEIYCPGDAPCWYDRDVKSRTGHLSYIDTTSYDFLVATSAPMIPEIMRLPAPRKNVVLLTTDYEPWLLYPEPGVQGIESIFTAAYALPAAVIATSRFVQSKISYNHGIEPIYVPVPVNAAAKAQRRDGHSIKTAGDGRARRLVMAGDPRLPSKGISTGLEALRHVAEQSPLEVDIVIGSAPIESIPPTHAFTVRAHRELSDAQVIELIGAADLFLCSSRYEGLGLPCLEAFSCGTPVVCTRNGGIDDFGRDGENVLLADPDDEHDIADKVLRLLSDATLRKALATTALEALDEYEPKQALRRMKQALESVPSVPIPSVPITTLDDLRSQLIATGAWTPFEIYDQFERLSKRWRHLVRALNDSNEREHVARELSTVRDECLRFVQPRTARYSNDFQKIVDGCGVALAFLDEVIAGVSQAPSLL